MTYTKRETTTNFTTIKMNFGTKDAQGREIGAEVAEYEVDFTEIPGANGGYTVEAGHYFGFRPHATRDGRIYGASQQEQLFTKEENRTKVVTKYIDNTRKRAIKR